MLDEVKLKLHVMYKLYHVSIAAVETPVLLAPVVQELDNAIHRINHYRPLDSTIGFSNIYPLDCDLSGG